MRRPGTARPAAETIPAEIRVLVAAAFIIAVGFGLIAPIIPQFARSFDVSMAAAGFVVSVFALSRLLFAPQSGRLVDRLGSRKVYITGLVTVATATGLVAVAQTYWQILLLRGIAGIGSTMFTVSAMGLIVRIAPPSIRGRATSTYATAFLVGSIIGPVIGAALSVLGMRPPFAIYAAALYLAAGVVWKKLNPATIYTYEHTNTDPPMTFRQALSDSAYRAALVGGFANGWANLGVRIALLPLFAAHAFHRGGAVAGIALAAFAVGNAAALQVSGRLADRIGRKPLVVAGLVVNAVFTAAIGLTDSPAGLLIVSVGAGAGAGLFVPAHQATIADVIGNKRSGGTVLARFQMCQDFGAIAGPVVVGALADRFGYAAGFGISGVVSLLAAVVWIVHGRETLPDADTTGGAGPAAASRRWWRRGARHTTNGPCAGAVAEPPHLPGHGPKN
ncbi:MFS transporter [Corynebacterium mendelii]|uniref:MFS transporter n=1 Tax=Corynebacterium mendelii TaxID=2765362 RepID=UPI002ED6B9F0